MLFTSYKFIELVLCLFAAYYIVPRRVRWPLLLVFSYVFYWLCDPKYLIFIGTTTVTAWGATVLMGRADAKAEAYLKANKENMTKDERKAYKKRLASRKKLFMVLCLLLNLGILAVTKYTNFVIANINTFLSKGNAIRAVDLIIPMGISFYTFQTMSYVIDCARGTCRPEKNPFKVALFVSFFPQLVQGPISRWNDLSKTLFEGKPFNASDFGSGLMRILWGYFKKVVIADRIITGVTMLISYPQIYTGVFVFCAMMFYAFELYCDFTGGIDITIGIAECLGIKVTENFNLPYFSKNIKEYWNRWHITMGTWFTDYIFYPLSVSPKMLDLSKRSRQKFGNGVGKRIPVYTACFLVWLTTGIWHGAAWNFIVWGLMNFVVIMASQELEPLYAKFHGRFGLKEKSGYKVFEIVRTILLMSMIRMFDCYRDVPLTFKMVGTMFHKFNFNRLTDGSLLKLGLSASDYYVLLAGLVIVFSVSLYKARKGTDIRSALRGKTALAGFVMVVLFAVIIVFGAYGDGYDSSQFIYNQF